MTDRYVYTQTDTYKETQSTLVSNTRKTVYLVKAEEATEIKWIWTDLTQLSAIKYQTTPGIWESFSDTTFPTIHPDVIQMPDGTILNFYIQTSGLAKDDDNNMVLLVIFINMLYPDNAFAKGYYGHSYNNTQPLASYSLAERTALYTLPFGLLALNQLSKPQITDPVVSYLNIDGTVQKENCFFVLTDELYISTSGRVYLINPKVPQYEFQVTPSIFILFNKGGTLPLFTFAPDPTIMKLLAQNIRLQKIALERTLKDYEAWLAWAGPAQIIFPEVNSESKDLAKLQNLKIIFPNLEAEFANMPFYPDDDNTYAKLGPGVYLSSQSALMIKNPNGVWTYYHFKNFPDDHAAPSTSPNPELDAYIEALIAVHLNNRGTPEAVKNVLQNGLLPTPRAP